MAKYRCPKFGCNGTGLPAGTKKAFNAGRNVIGDTPAYLSGRYSNSRLLSTFGYKGKRILTFECQKCGRKWQQRL
ncbi:MAG: hypothetical protein K6G27_04740 [Lachnospiraceae bacterium]|nr:hypothetical protein [Lachnospiraceae bacterium]